MTEPHRKDAEAHRLACMSGGEGKERDSLLVKPECVVALGRAENRGYNCEQGGGKGV